MKKTACLVVFILSSLSISTAYAQSEIIKFPRLKGYISESNPDQKIKVINFWATWCGPCVKELPFIDSLQYSYDPEAVEVKLISLDFADQLDRVDKFLKRKNITSSVWILDESDANSYIDRVDPRWSGAIPATLLINTSTGQRIFLEKELTKGELEQHIKILMN